MTKLNKHGIPEFAMWMQALLVCILIFLISFGGGQAKSFYTILTDMSNVSTSFPYLFLVGAFPVFKKKDLSNHLSLTRIILGLKLLPTFAS